MGSHQSTVLADLLADLRLAALSRALDDKEIALQKQNRAFFQISGAGHEALCLGVARSLRAGHDWFFPYYRDRSLALGLGVSPEDLLRQAVGAAADPSSGGRQMPSHFGDRARHIVSQTSATGSQMLPAVGCAEAGRYLLTHPAIGSPAMARPDEITYVSIGDGATSQGEFWEALNTAANAALPLLIVVADNGWAISVPASQHQPAPISRLASGFDGIEIVTVDGTDYAAVRDAAQRICGRLRHGGGPVLLHASVTRPYSHSSADTQAKYRTAADLAHEAERDPLRRMAALAVNSGLLTDDDVADLLNDARRRVDAAATSVLAEPAPSPTSATDHVVSIPAWPAPSADPPAADDAQPLTMADAIGRCLAEVMAADERIRVFGEDVADAPEESLGELEGKGGVFGITAGLQRRFGSDRCFNTPLAEANIVGRAVGQAIRGLKPVPEVQFFDYIWTAMQQIRTEAATLRWRSHGSYSAPLVLRVPIGGYLAGGAIWHSQSGESIFAHTPGLLVAMPSTAADAVGLLRAALRCDDPVLFLEHKHLYRQSACRSPYPPPEWLVPFGTAATRRRGEDVTVVTWGATVAKSLEAATTAASEAGVEADVIDLRTLIPWDRQAVADSLGRTGRLLIVHEDVRTCGFGAEVAAWVADECFDLLDAPVRRVAALDTFVGYAPSLEDMILPQSADIADALIALCER